MRTINIWCIECLSFQWHKLIAGTDKAQCECCRNETFIPKGDIE